MLCFYNGHPFHMAHGEWNKVVQHAAAEYTSSKPSLSNCKLALPLPAPTAHQRHPSPSSPSPDAHQPNPPFSCTPAPPLHLYNSLTVPFSLSLSILLLAGRGPTVLLCSPPDFVKMFTKSTDKNRQVPGCLLLMCVHLGYDWECF